MDILAFLSFPILSQFTKPIVPTCATMHKLSIACQYFNKISLVNDDGDRWRRSTNGSKCSTTSKGVRKEQVRKEQVRE